MKIYTEERKTRMSLTLLFTGIILIFLLVTVAVVAGIISLLVMLGVLKWTQEGGFSYGLLILITVAGSFVIGFLLTFFYSRVPLKPINKILNALNRLASGDYTPRLSFKGPFSKHPAVEEMTNSFNAMATELQQTELLRSDFINNFSHEFKTPIVSIAGFAGLLKKPGLSEEERAEYLDIIEKESLRLSQMATNVLNLSKVESQTILTDVTEWNLSEQIRTAVLLLEGKWSKKDLNWELDFEEYPVLGNEELMRQVWINLLDNAIKFSPDHGTVSVEIRPVPKGISVLITNASDPIPPEKLDRIFNKFYQADESHSIEGNGVGLAVAKKIIELHEGDIRADCANGKITFTVTLPND